MHTNPNCVRNEGGRRRWPTRLAWLPIPVLVTAIAVFWAADLQGSHESLYLLLTLNLVFSMPVCLFVAYLITRSFLVSGKPGLLLLGCGVVIWGPAGVVATAAARGDANISITIYNSCLWLSGLCHLAGVSLSLRSRRSLSPAALWLPAGYALAAGAVMLVTLSALAGWIPTFFVEDRGGTPTRQIVLGSAVAMFSLTALLLGTASRRNMSAFAYWYALALTLIAAGLFGVMLQSYHASILGWTGRATQGLGGLYMLIAAVASVRESHGWEISLETALRKSEERYRLLFTNMSEAFFLGEIICDEQGKPCDYRCREVNPAFEVVTGIKRGQILGRTLRELSPNPGPAVIEKVGEVALSGRPRHFDVFSQLLGKHFEVYAFAPERGKFGAVFVDITERRQAQEALRDANENLRVQAEQLQSVNEMLQARQAELEEANEGLRMQERELQDHAEALRESEERFRVMADGVPLMIWATDATGHVQFVNRAYAGFFGVLLEDVQAAGWEPLVHPEDRAAYVREYMACLREQRPFHAEARVRRHDGRWRWVESFGQPRISPSGEFLGIAGSSSDITERKQSEEVLRIKDSAIASSLNAFAMADLQGRLTYVNPAFLKLWGYGDEHEILGKSVLDFWHEPQRAREVVQAISNGAGWVGELVAIRKDGGRMSLYISTGTVRNDAGTPICMMSSFVDITERKRAEGALNQALLDTQRRCAETSALMAGTRAVLEYQDLVPAARAVFDACRELLGAPAGYVALLSPDGKYNEVLFLEPGGSSCTVDPSLPMPLRGFRAQVHRLERVMYENDFASSPWTELLPPGHVRLENVLFAPLVIDGHALGLLGLGNKPGGFTDHDATLAATFGELIAIALRNSRALESLRELTTTLESKVAARTAELELRAKQLQKLTLELSQAEDRERRRIALVLHEDLQQHIAGAKFHTNLLKNRARHDPVQQAIAVKVDAILKEAIEKSRSLSHELSPAVLHMNDLAEALRWLAGDMRVKHGLTVHVDVSREATVPPEALGMFLFRAAQEMLFNTLKHAGVHEAGIRVRRMGRYVCLCVSDRGCGFDPQELKATSGLGLLSIRERVELLGGRMKIKSIKGTGSRFHIVVPDGRKS